MATTVANRAIKARGKASPDRIQDNIQNAKVIKDQQVLNNDVIHIAENEELNIESLPAGNISVPLSFWLEHSTALKERVGSVAVQISADESPEELANDLSDLVMIVLPFVSYVDGRSYSHAHKLRLRHDYKGEVRAVGAVHFDQLDFLARCGCDAFELPDGDDHEAALAAFTEFTEVYQPAADGGRLVFARRRTVH